MKLNKKTVAIVASILIIGATIVTKSIKSNTEAAEKAATATADSITYDLRIATLPTLDALPFYIAEKNGAFDSLGLKVQLLMMNAQFDCDTALLGGTIDAVLMDQVRQAKYEAEGKQFCSLHNISTPLSLVISKDLGTQKVQDLRNHTLAISRQSADISFAEQIFKIYGLKNDEVHYPQINDLRLRTTMLTHRQVDAAILPEPMATMAQLNGHHILYKGAVPTSGTNQLVFKADSQCKDKLSALADAYMKAKAELDKKKLADYRSLLITKFNIPEAVVDTLITR